MSDQRLEMNTTLTDTYDGIIIKIKDQIEKINAELSKELTWSNNYNNTEKLTSNFLSLNDPIISSKY